MEFLKKNISKFVGITLLLLLIFPSVLSAESLRFVLDFALEHNAALLASQEQVAQADLQLSAVKAYFNPSLNLSSAYRYVSEEPSLTVGPVVSKLGVHNNYDLGLNLNYLVFNGFAKESKINMLELQKKAADLQLQKKQKEISWQIVNVYKNLQQLILQTKIIKTSLDRISVQRATTSSRVDNGTSLAIELLSLDLSKSKAEQEIIMIEANIENLNETLQNLVGRSVTIDEPNLASMMQAIPSCNLEANEDWQLLKMNNAILEQNRLMVLGKYWPSIGFNADLKYGKPGLNPPKDVWMSYYMLTLGVSWPLFDWDSSKLDSQAIEKNLKAQVNLEKVLKDNLLLVYHKVVREYNTLNKQINVAQEALKLATEKVRLVRQQSNQGVLSSSDFNTANLELTEADLHYKNTQLALSTKIIELDYLSNQPINKWRLE